MHVALPAAPPGTQHELLPMPGQVGDDFRLRQLGLGQLLRLCPKIDLERLRFKRAVLGHVLLPGLWLGRRKFPHQRAARHLDDELLAAAPGLALALAGPPVLGVEMRRIKLRDKIVDVVVGLQDDIAPFAAVATARPALGLERFMRKRNASVAALAGPGLNLD